MKNKDQKAREIIIEMPQEEYIQLKSQGNVLKQKITFLQAQIEFLKHQLL
jgi:hypothetical protein